MKKEFELGQYIKPMISKTGIIASRKNQHLIHSLNKLMNKPTQETIVDYRSRFPIVIKRNSSEKKERNPSYSFKAIARKQNNDNESLPPNRYSPNYSFLYKKSPGVVFGKEKNRELFRKMEDYTSFDSYKGNDSPKRVPGVPFDKQLERKWGGDERPHEKRFESHDDKFLSSSHKVHSFESYTPRKTFFLISEFQPEYHPNYSFVAKIFKDTKSFD